MPKDLSELGFGPPDLKLPTGECKNGHPWANNLRHRIATKTGKSTRYCLTCYEGHIKKAHDKRRAKKLNKKTKW